MEAAHDYHFVTHWRVRGEASAVWDLIASPLDLPRWWPSVYLSIREIAPDTIELHTKGWLPYTLRWQSRRLSAERPHRYVIAAMGDFVGTGEWTLRQDGDVVDVVFDWSIRAEKPMLRALSPLLKPVFSANHRWAMARGEESLARELARRRGEAAPP